MIEAVILLAISAMIVASIFENFYKGNDGNGT